jgi:hypothetical protein
MPDSRTPWAYLEGVTPAEDAPTSDNPSGLYCPDCRRAGFSHCASPEYCGGMKPMRPAHQESKP